MDCLCNVLAAYAKACADKNIDVNGWRNITDCARGNVCHIVQGGLSRTSTCFASVCCRYSDSALSYDFNLES